ncbi:MAG: Lrp/AsnC family transcriptional regulator [Nanoarchaeota archaeon]
MIENLDLKNRRILYELEQDSRQSLQEIAKKVRLKKETVFHRMKNLEKLGIIKNYLTEVDIYKLGYQFYPMLIRYQNTNPEIENKIYDFLKKNKFVSWLTKSEGNWDINLALIAKNNFEIKKFLDEFYSKFDEYIGEKHILITTEIYYFKRGFWLNKPSNETVTTGQNDSQKIKLDELDYKLLKILSSKARKPLIEIADELKMNPKNISYKIKKLEKEQIIQGSRILVDFSKMGYKFYKVWFSLKNINPENFQKLLLYFKQNPNIIWATKTIGYYDLSIEMEVKDVDEFRKILDEIKEKFSNFIKKHESLLIFEEGILNYFP